MLHSVSLHWGRSQYRICPILFHFFSLYNLNSYFDVPTSVATAAAILHVSVQHPSQPSRLSPRELWDTVSVGWAGSFGLRVRIALQVKIEGCSLCSHYLKHTVI